MMKTSISTRRMAVAACVVGLVLAAIGADAGDKIKITVQKAKQYRFEGRHTYAWHPEEPVSVKVLQSMGDPEKIKAWIAPMVSPIVEQELARRGFTKVEADKADFYVCYYLLVGPNYTSQYQGQFIGAIPAWGLPDFAMATTSLKVIDQGSLVVDVMSKELKATIWRGVAATQINGRLNDDERKVRFSKSIADMMKEFPPKDQKPDAK
jgi:hypothetical protein